MKTTTTHRVGVYCLANDEVLEWFQGFVRSLRKHEPGLPLTVIPYNASYSKLLALRSQFNFEVMSEAAFTRFDSIASRVAGQRIAGGTFRKLCCFFGEYETFLFLDSDIVVTGKLDMFLNTFDGAAADLVYFDSDITMAYTPEFGRRMAAEYGSPGFTSGSWIARRGCFTEAEIMSVVESGEKIRDQFSIWGEQPFFNYLFDVTRRRKIPSWTFDPHLVHEPSARDIRYNSKDDAYHDSRGRRIPFIHWAGCEWPTMFRPEIFLRHRTLGMGSLEKLVYVLNFYYRRFRRNLKDVMHRSPWFANWVKRRDERLNRKRLKMSSKTK
jgi:hypothetical protein